MRRRKVGQAYPESPESVRAVSARHALPPLIARLLLNRGLAEAEEILAYLEPHLGRLTPPSVLPEVKVAAARLARAVGSRETVAVYGDYDADGLTATCLLQQFFRELGVNAVTYIPDRLTEGYGLNLPALQGLAKQARLLVTVDCGVSDLEEVAWAGEQGIVSDFGFRAWRLRRQPCR